MFKLCVRMKRVANGTEFFGEFVGMDSDSYQKLIGFIKTLRDIDENIFSDDQVKSIEPTDNGLKGFTVKSFDRVLHDMREDIANNALPPFITVQSMEVGTDVTNIAMLIGLTTEQLFELVQTDIDLARSRTQEA